MKDGEQRQERAGSTVPGMTGIRRRALLAKIHIAAKELAVSKADYRARLMGEFGVPSAADLSTEEMERLLKQFAALGWRPKGRSDLRVPLAARRRRRQVTALQARVREIFAQLEDSDERRLEGLCEKICGSRDLASCRDTGKLRRILAVLAGIRKRESGRGQRLH